jgi:aryl-alcohol dehydrogenase (NADP+)
MLPLCLDQGVGVIPWSPLARGWLTRSAEDKTSRSESDKFGAYLYKKTQDADRAIIDKVGEIAAARALPRAQIALAWLLTKPGVSAPIVGATKPQHLADAIAAIDVKLSAEEIAALEAPYVPHPVVGFQ